MKKLFKRFKKPKKKKDVSDMIKFIETNSTVPPTGKVMVSFHDGKKARIFSYDYFAPKPTDEILEAFVDTLKLPNVKRYWYE